MYMYNPGQLTHVHIHCMSFRIRLYTADHVVVRRISITNGNKDVSGKIEKLSMRCTGVAPIGEADCQVG